MNESLPEPWLRGILSGLDPVTEHLLRGSEQIREDLARAIRPLTLGQLWSKPHGMTSAGFHAKHLAQSSDRLCTYLLGRELSVEQLAVLEKEGEGGESAGDLIQRVDEVFARYEQIVRGLSPERFGEVRHIGRKRLQTTAVSLAIHIAEHGQRHVGQAISAARLAQG